MRRLKYRIGVLFCGGCNCYYDREEFYGEIREKLSGICDFSLYSDEKEEKWDLILLINGCQSECLVHSGYDPEPVLINNKNYRDGEKILRERLLKLESSRRE